MTKNRGPRKGQSRPSHGPHAQAGPEFASPGAEGDSPARPVAGAGEPGGSGAAVEDEARAWTEALMTCYNG